METPSSETHAQARSRVSQHRLRRRVQFYETDMAGVVHFSWYFRYMEEAEHALWRAAGLSVASPTDDLGWPRVSTSFEYRRPLKFEDEFDVLVRITEIGDRTIAFACEISRNDTHIARGAMTVACVRHHPDGTMRAIAIPLEIAGRFEVARDGV